MLSRRVKSGAWLRPTARVLVLAGSPESFERDAWIALTNGGPEAGLTHETGLASWKVPGFRLRPIHITHARSASVPSIEGVVAHRPELWPRHHRILLNGMPIATPTRALFDLANEGLIHPLRLERAVNNAWARGLTSGERLTQMAGEWCERGRRGSAFIHRYLDRHPIAWQPPESNLEARFVEIVVGAGMPEPKRQKNLGDDDSWIGRVDMLDPELPLIAEIDSTVFHTAPLDAESDELRDERLTAAGFRVEHFTEYEIWHDASGVSKRWRVARTELRQR
ncbi:MAG: hypothetical protein QOF21_1723 [Actinomycetota bacterium]|jgi:hypothetical protein